MKYKISFCLIAAGIMLFLLPMIGAFYLQYSKAQLYKSYLDDRYPIILSDTTDREKSLAMIHNASGIQQAAFADGLEDAAVPVTAAEDKPAVLGRIIIQKIDADLILVEGAGSKELKWGAGHITGTCFPGEAGNCGIAAHRNYIFGSYFSRLDELKEGDTVTVEYNGETLSYSVYNIKTVLPEDNTVLQPPEEGEMLTLVTCAPKGGNSHRLILHCLPSEASAPPAGSAAALQQP